MQVPEVMCLEHRSTYGKLYSGFRIYFIVLRKFENVNKIILRTLTAVRCGAKPCQLNVRYVQMREN